MNICSAELNWEDKSQEYHQYHVCQAHLKHNSIRQSEIKRKFFVLS
jgi:hypothetical protein